MPPPKSPDEARANDIAQKSESMARELSQKREMRIRQDRVRHLSSDDAAREGARDNVDKRTGSRSAARVTPPPRNPIAEDKTVRAEDRAARNLPRPESRDTRVEPPPSASPPFYPEHHPGLLDEVAGELDELFRDLRGGWRRWPAPDRITFAAAVSTLVGVLLPWTSEATRGFQLGVQAGGSFHAALAIAAIALLVTRSPTYEARQERLSARERRSRARRTSLWHLLLGAASTLLCMYFLVGYGLQRGAVAGLEVRFGLYVTLAAGMGLSYGGFARFFSRRHD